VEAGGGTSRDLCRHAAAAGEKAADGGRLSGTVAPAWFASVVALPVTDGQREHAATPL